MHYERVSLIRGVKMIRLSRNLLEAFWWISSRALCVYCVLFGLAVIFGGEQRMPDPTYAAMKSWAPPWLWGLTIIVGTLVALFGRGRVSIIACIINAFWFGCYGAAFLIAYFVSDISPLTAAMTYFFMTFCWVLVARVVHERRKDDINDL